MLHLSMLKDIPTSGLLDELFDMVIAKYAD